MKNALLLIAFSSLMASCSLTGKATTPPVINTVPSPTLNTTATGDTPITTTVNQMPKAANYTLADVEKHSTSSDCWLVLDGGVYDITQFIPAHPGGEKILKGCGKDATQMFAKHPESAKAMKERFKIGDLAQ